MNGKTQSSFGLGPDTVSHLLSVMGSENSFSRDGESFETVKFVVAVSSSDIWASMGELEFMDSTGSEEIQLVRRKANRFGETLKTNWYPGHL